VQDDRGSIIVIIAGESYQMVFQDIRVGLATQGAVLLGHGKSLRLTG